MTNFEGSKLSIATSFGQLFSFILTFGNNYHWLYIVVRFFFGQSECLLMLEAILEPVEACLKFTIVPPFVRLVLEVPFFWVGYILTTGLFIAVTSSEIFSGWNLLDVSNYIWILGINGTAIIIIDMTNTMLVVTS